MMRLYRLLTEWGIPLIWLTWRELWGREDRPRRGERRGQSSIPRPAGNLIWIHAASVGESVSILALVDRLLERDRSLHVLVTTGTVTSARVMQQRLPFQAVHQFVPIDCIGYVRRFLDHWKPGLALFTESEIWPNLLTEIRKSQCPAVLINARMSERSFRRWQRTPYFVASLLANFEYCLAQSARDAHNLRTLGARKVYEVGNLKYSAPPLPVDQQALAVLTDSCKQRVVWLLASSHPGEEELGLQVHQALAPRIPGLLTIIVPRHPHRGATVAAMLSDSNLAVTRRSMFQLPASNDLYVVDTIGELGLFFRLAKVACIGGSLVARGGHNPLEPLRLGCAVIYGQHMFNFREITAELEAAGAARVVSDLHQLVEVLAELLTDESARGQSLDSAREVIERNQYPLDRTLELLEQAFQSHQAPVPWTRAPGTRTSGTCTKTD